MAGTPEITYVAVPVTAGRLPRLPPNRDVALSGDVATCVTLSGFGAAQTWGRATEAEVSTIRFRCGCPSVPGGYDLVLTIGVPDGAHGETVRLAVEGGSPKIETFAGSGFRDVAVPLPPGLLDDDAVDVAIKIPEDKSQADGRTALLVARLEVHERP